FVDGNSLKSICSDLDVEYEDMIRYLLSRKYLLRVFRGVFYVRSPEEIVMGRNGLSHLEIVANGLRIKGVGNWYFGLHTALRLNGATHEFFPVDFVLSDKIFRARETNIAGHKFKFVKIKSSLFFGIDRKNELRYSDLEKTLLDFTYLWRYRGIPEHKIVLDISELVGVASSEKLAEYSTRYPRTVRKTLEKVR
ncbi:MAG: hypothetical protein ACETV1_06225, partial [Candidatus Bathyarchaeia archaeon]